MMKNADTGLTLLDNELEQLRKEIVQMWQLVISQLEKSKAALASVNKDIAEEVVRRESLVNAHELKIDKHCENIFALFTPVAADLRFVLAILKINTNLERIGDIAEGVARFVSGMQPDFDDRILGMTRVLEMFDHSISITTQAMDAFENEDTALARKIFGKDNLLDDINSSAARIIAGSIKDQTDVGKIEHALYILSTIRKLERVGDQATNIAEELIFYAEAKVLKHQFKDKKG
jgi:phosphate transport system protein